MPKKIPLNENPEVKDKLDKAVVAAKEAQVSADKEHIQSLLAINEVKQIFEDILETSSMSEQFKTYLRSFFLERKPKKQAIRKAFGRDLGYQEEAISEGIMESKAVKEFLDLVKLFYVRVAPVAALKEVEIMMSGTGKTALDAAKDIQDRAGVGVEQGKAKELPVNIVINMPGSVPPQPAIEGETIDG